MRLEYLQLRKFHLPVRTRRIVSAFIEQEPFQKGRLIAARASKDFRKALAEGMERARVKYFRGDVAIEFHFSSGSPNAPQHHRLIKNYVDLIDEALLKDDRQVRIIESCHFKRMPPVGDRQPLIRVTIMPFGLYRQKQQLLWQHDDEWYSAFDYEYDVLEDDDWDYLIRSADSEMGRRVLENERNRAREERVLCSLSRRDDPVFGDIHAQYGLPELPFLDPRTLRFPLPLKDPRSTVERYRKVTGIEKIRYQSAVDLNLEIVNFSKKDIDNLYIDVIGELRWTLLDSPIGDVRVYRRSSGQAGPELRVKLLKPHAVWDYMHQVDESLERALDSLEESW